MLDHQHEEMGRAAGVEPSFRAFTEHPRYRTSTHAIVRGAGIEPALLRPERSVLPKTLPSGAPTSDRTTFSRASTARYDHTSSRCVAS
jgi:hypothetical protein